MAERVGQAFAAELRALLLLADARRTSRGQPRWTSTRLGSALEIDPSLVRRWLRGERVPSLQSGHVDALATVLQLDEAQRRSLETAQIQALRVQTSASVSSRQLDSAHASLPSQHSNTVVQQTTDSDEPHTAAAAADAGRPATQWLTLAELRAGQAVHEHVQKWRTVLEQYEGEYAQLKAMEDAARKSGNNARRLLTTTGNQLVLAVLRVLHDLDFTTAPMQSQTSRADEFRIRSPSPMDWECLALIRGYTRGLQVADLVRLGSSSAVYGTIYGHPPNAVWYVVNQYATTDPDTRPQPFRDQLDGASALWEIGGLIVDTRDLFRCWNAVDSGALRPEDARALLLGARGQFTYLDGS